MNEKKEKSKRETFKSRPKNNDNDDDDDVWTDYYIHIASTNAAGERVQPLKVIKLMCHGWKYLAMDFIRNNQNFRR